MHPETDFCRPASVADALGMIEDGESMLLSGGTSIGLLLGQGLIEPTRLVWLGGIPGFADITVRDATLRIGAGATLRQLERHPDIRALVPAIAQAASSVGNPRIRAVATLGGALAHGDPRQDLPPALAACGAVVEISGPGGTRRLSVDELAVGFLETAVGADELIVAAEIPVGPNRNSVYLRYTPGSQADFPTVSAAAAAAWTPGGALLSVTLVMGGVGPTPIVVAEASSLSGGEAPTGRDVQHAFGSTDLADRIAGVADAARTRTEPLSDRLGSESYKREMAAVWARRALQDCLLRVPGDGPVAT